MWTPPSNRHQLGVDPRASTGRLGGFTRLFVFGGKLFMVVKLKSLKSSIDFGCITVVIVLAAISFQ